MLYLVQHAEAKDADEDPNRDLSDVGLMHARAAARFMHERAIRPGLIWHSGKLRAQHTAQIIARAIGAPEPTVHAELGPSDDPSRIADEIVELEEAGLMIVGHLPYLTRLTALLLDAHAGRSPVRFRNAGIVALARVDDAWWVEWSMIPQLMQEENRDR